MIAEEVYISYGSTDREEIQDLVRADPDFIKIYKDAGIYEHYTTGSSK